MIGIDRAKVTATINDILSIAVHDPRGRDDIPIDPSSSLFDLSLDEIDVTHITIELEDIYCISIPDDAIQLTDKASDIINLVLDKLREKAEAAE